MQAVQKLLVFTFILFIVGCGEDTSTTGEQADRPHYPWAFRSVLDLQPRMLTFALTDDLWAAYRVDKGALYKVWKGGVNFDGPVYTTHHGPQPISIGDAYTVNEVKNPWSVKLGGESSPATVNYKGHSILDNRATMFYELMADGLDKPIEVEEYIESETTESGNPIYIREFTTKNVPEGAQVLFQNNVSSIIIASSIETDGDLSIEQEDTYSWNNKELVRVNASLALISNGSTSYKVKFISQPTINNPNKDPNAKEEESSSGLPEGAKLIAQNDCKTCHNKKVKTIGPAYVAVAERYKTTEDNIAMLVTKVKNGGTGKWGNQVMNAHPDLSEVKIKKMVEYILSLDAGMPSELGDGEAVEEEVASFEASKVEESALIPGLATFVYNIPRSTHAMPQKGAWGKPIYGGVISELGNVEGEDFTDLSEYFGLTSEGYLYMEDDGEVGFRMWSDDGSILYVGGEKVVDNDGDHGTEYKEATLNLKRGYHPIRIEFYQGGGGKFLSFNWKKANMERWETVPANALFHESGSYNFGDLTLPMATVTKIPGDRSSLLDVHPAFTLSQARPETFTPKVGGIDFLSDGSMVVSTWDAAGSVYKVTNPASGDPSSMEAIKIAEGLAEPLGLKVVNDEIYIMQKQELTKLVDTDQDGQIDRFETISDEWGVSPNFHEFGFGLAYKDNHFYATLATAIEPGGASTSPQIKDRGKCVKINRETGETSFIASGLRTPNGIGVGYNGDLYIADNQGDWLPSSKILHVSDGAWFGSRSVDPEASANWTEKKPVVWLPQDEIGNSPSTPLALDLGPYKGQMIHGEVTHGGVKRVFVEEVEGEYQGAVFRFIQGLEAGVNRLAWGPDGALYAGGIGAPGNWGQTGKLWYGLQRLEYNGTSAFEMLAVRAKSDGIEIEFTEPLREGDGWLANDYEIEQWKYVPTKDYGGPKVDNTTLPIKSVSVSDDRKRVFLELDGMKDDHVIYVLLKNHFVSENSNSLWSTEAWYTMNKIPENLPGEKNTLAYTPKDNELTPNEKAAGWELLFDGKSMDQWHNFNKDTRGKSWIIKDNAIFLNSVKKDEGGWQAADGGDLVSADSYENFELNLEWKISNCGNSGIMFNVVESKDYDYPYQTAPEMQILDNTCHPDTRFEKHRAGDLYDMKETKYITVNPAGEWNKVRIISNKGEVEFWLNGYKVVDFTFGSEEWKEMLENSKFKGWKGFGEAKAGKISLQDHGDPVWFKNIKIKRL
jgi:cytochrome c